MAILSFVYHKMRPNQWKMLPASHAVIPSQLPAWPGEIQPIKDHLTTHACLTELRNQLE